MTGGRKGPRALSEDERALWGNVTRAVRPLKRATAKVAAQTGAGVGAREGAGQAPLPKAPATTGKIGPKAAPKSQPAKTAPPLAPLGRRQKQKIARGHEPIDARIDLHGLTQSEAHHALVRFLRNQHGEGASLVLVITGKGARDDSDRGVLRRQVPHWLESGECRPLVVGFEPAHVGHGGEGALYVRIRRGRGAG